jgi:hypothetical protein
MYRKAELNFFRNKLGLPSDHIPINFEKLSNVWLLEALLYFNFSGKLRQPNTETYCWQIHLPTELAVLPAARAHSALSVR